MDAPIPREILDRITSFGELLRYLRRRARLSQTELSIAVGYSDAQISRLEQNLRLPNVSTVQARFLPVLRLKGEQAASDRLLRLAEQAQKQRSDLKADADGRRPGAESSIPCRAALYQHQQDCGERVFL